MTVFIKKYWRYVLILCILAAAVFGLKTIIKTRSDAVEESEADIKRADAGFTQISDNELLYKNEDIDKVYKVYLTVYTGIDAGSGEEFDLKKMNDIYGAEADPKLKCGVYVVDSQSGDIVAGDKGNAVNGTIELRGQSARIEDQKSYKVRLSNDTKKFQGQKILNLNKHISDNSRVAQKFCYDCMRLLKDFSGMRTNFMEVYIKDGTKKNSDYVNYGLFTHVENPDEDYLAARNLDVNASFYKPRDFEFMTWEIEKSEAGELFDTVLKSMGREDYGKLKRMIEAVNENGTDYDEIFETYFDRDNYMTWLAVNLLFNNYDTMSRNFLLYSPSNIDKWYFLPWDYDVCMIPKDQWEESEYAKWYGIQRYWGSPIHRKFFQNPDNVRALCKKIDSIYETIKSSDIEARCEKYAAVYENYVMTSKADTPYLTEEAMVDFDDILRQIRNMPELIDYYYELFYERLEYPMPFFLGEIKQENHTLTLNWSDSYDLQNDMLYYEVSIYTNPDSKEKTTLFKEKTASTHVRIENLDLEDGTYYWEAVAVDSEGHRQISFDRCSMESGLEKTIMFGLKKFTVTDGIIKEEEAAEE